MHNGMYYIKIIVYTDKKKIIINKLSDILIDVMKGIVISENTNNIKSISIRKEVSEENKIVIKVHNNEL
jgi:hypothetical protein